MIKEGDIINKSKKAFIILLGIIIGILGINFSINKTNQRNFVYEEYIRRYTRIQDTIEQLILNLEREAFKSQLDSRDIVNHIAKAEEDIMIYSTHMPRSIDAKTSSAWNFFNNEIGPTFVLLKGDIEIRREKSGIDLAYMNHLIDLLKQLNDEMRTVDREFDLIFTDERREKINSILKEIS